MKKSICAIFSFIYIFITTIVPANASSMSAFIDAPSSVEKGKSFTVSVRFESEIEAYLSAEFSYDEDMVEYVSSSSSDVNKVGNSIYIVPLSGKTSHKFNFVFKMKNTGNASFNVKVSESISLDENSLGTPSARATVKGVAASVTPTQKPTTKPTAQPTSRPTVKPTSTPTASSTDALITPSSIPTATPTIAPTPANSMEFLYNNEIKYISEDFDETQNPMPEGFKKNTFNFKNNNIFVARNEFDIIMVYATDVVGKNGNYYIYNNTTDTFTLYQEYFLGEKGYIFTEPHDLPKDFSKTTIELNEYKGITAYSIPLEGYSEFVALYGFIPGYAPTYYIYDTLEGTIQRCVNISMYTMPEIVNSAPPISPSPNINIPIGDMLDNTNKLTKVEKPGFIPKIISSIKDFAHKAIRFARLNVLLMLITLCIILAIVAILIIFIICKKKSNKDNYEPDLYNDDLENSNEDDAENRLEADTSSEAADIELDSLEEDSFNEIEKPESTEPWLNISEILKNDDSDDDLYI